MKPAPVVGYTCTQSDLVNFNCNRCGAKDSITLSVDEGAAIDGTIVCTACGARAPRREYELQRVKLEFARARAAERVGVPNRFRGETGACPACGDPLFRVEIGCARCGHGRRSFVARHAGHLASMSFFVLLLLGAFGVALVGLIARRTVTTGVLMTNAIFVFTGALLFAIGIRALRDPTSMQLVDVAGTDASGVTHYSNPRQATRAQGTTIGGVSLVVGFVIVLVGVFVGPLAYALGMLTG